MWNFILFLFFGVTKLLTTVLLVNGALHLGQREFGSLVVAGASSCLVLAVGMRLVSLSFTGLF